jgi:hypothetical protein
VTNYRLDVSGLISSRSWNFSFQRDFQLGLRFTQLPISQWVVCVCVCGGGGGGGGMVGGLNEPMNLIYQKKIKIAKNVKN